MRGRDLADRARRCLLTLCLALAPYNAVGAEGLQCVPYARELTGIQIRGDAHTWWGQAEGRYERGNKPRPGAIMSFRPYGKMELGHIAAVQRVIDDRRVIISHANWSTIDGRRGHIENDVLAMDVSRNNDWSKVRVWYTPIGKLGTTAWPLNGFIYPDAARSDTRYAARDTVEPDERMASAGASDPIGDLIAATMN